MGDVVILYGIWFILQLFDIIFGHSVYLMVIWDIFPCLVCCTKKNLATLGLSSKDDLRPQSESYQRISHFPKLLLMHSEWGPFFSVPYLENFVAADLLERKPV
jgi:hypothetical protein